MKRKARISNKILLFVSITIILAIGLVLGITSLLLTDYNNETIVEEVKSGVFTLSEKVEDLKASTLGFAKLSASQVAEKLSAENLDNTAKSILDSTKTDYVILTDKNGEVIGSAGQINSKNLISIQIVGDALKGSTTTTVESEIIGRFSALTAAPVKNSEGSIEGAIIIGYALDNESLVDDIKEAVKTDVTIFQGDTRINTTIMKDGNRQVGTQLSEAVANIVITEGNEYDGEADILGSRYLCSYRPLMNHNNEIVGVLFAGKSVEAATRLLNLIAVYTFSAAVLAVLVIIVVLVVYLRNVLTIPLKKVMNAAEEISQGNLDIELKIKANNEIGMLSDTFIMMADKLHGLIGQVNESSEKVAAASKEIASSSLSLSKGSVEQAATVQELGSSAMEVLSMTQSNADNAKNASILSETVKEKCTEGSEKMTNLLDAMNGINDSSKKISKIIKVIDDIAFQTNILSLNAAVEAAQAGQYGKGFTVVAEKVKQLAQKSAKAAKEIAGMIEESVTSASSGSALANETASILTDIFEKINEVHTMIASISSSSTEQSSGIAQINSAIERISGILQSYASMAEESSASSAKLSEEADVLKQQISSFKLRKQ